MLEPFLDTSHPTLVKKMRNIAVAEATDSRIVWQRLTDAIVADNNHAAADAKHEVRYAVFQKKILIGTYVCIHE